MANMHGLQAGDYISIAPTSSVVPSGWENGAMRVVTAKTGNTLTVRPLRWYEKLWLYQVIHRYLHNRKARKFSKELQKAQTGQGAWAKYFQTTGLQGTGTHYPLSDDILDSEIIEEKQ